VAEIFISYVQEDGDVAREIADGLEGAGYSVWYYERDSLPGYSYLEQILEVIDQARAVVVVLSPAALGSPQVNIEISEAHTAGKRFVPLLRDLDFATLSSRQRPWTMMFGTAVAAPIPREGVTALLPRLVRGLQALGVEPGGSGAAAAPSAPAPFGSVREARPLDGALPRAEPGSHPETAATAAKPGWAPAHSEMSGPATGTMPVTPAAPIAGGQPWYRRRGVVLAILAIVIVIWFFAARGAQWREWEGGPPGAGGPPPTTQLAPVGDAPAPATPSPTSTPEPTNASGPPTRMPGSTMNTPLPPTNTPGLATSTPVPTHTPVPTSTPAPTGTTAETTRRTARLVA
jgi:hypothetical protein